jgi:capsular exopolysaccharide synthesis family protein
MTEQLASIPMLAQPDAPTAEAFRALRTTVRYQALAHASKVLLVTSAEPRAGKSFVSANLAVALAQMDLRVALVDANLRAPALHVMLGIPRCPGLAEYLAGTVNVPPGDDYGAVPRLTILPAGMSPAQPAELLASQRMADLLAHLRSRFDHVVLDTPAVLQVADAGALVSQVDGVLLVMRANATKREHAQRAKAMLERVGGRLLGVVFNDDPAASSTPLA